MTSGFKDSKCESRCLSQSQVLPFPDHYSRAATSFELIHTDVWGIAPTLSIMEFKYYVTFIDNYCRYTWIYFLRSKSDVFVTFQKIYNMIHTQFGKSIKNIQSDSWGEYIFGEFSTFLSEKGIIHQKSCPHTPQLNGIAERKH